MTDMLDLITLFAGIGIGWLMGRTLRDRIIPVGPENAAGKPRNGTRGDEQPDWHSDPTQPTTSPQNAETEER